MGIAQRKERQKAELRDQILTAAREIVLTEGFEALSMRKIAEAIEYSPATIYLHFATRDEIALQLVREGFAQLLLAMAPVQSIVDPTERLMEIGRRYIHFAMEQPETYRLIFMENPKFSSEVIGQILNNPSEPGERAFAILAETVGELIAQKRFRPVDPEQAAEVLWAGVHGVASLRIACHAAGTKLSEDMEKQSELMLEVMMRGLTA